MTPFDRVRDLHASLPVVDGHNDLAWALRTAVDGDLDVADPRGHLPEMHTDTERLLAGGVGGQFWSVYVPADHPTPHDMVNLQIDLVEHMIRRDERLVRADTAEDVRRARAGGRIASLLGAEGGHSIESSIGKLEQLRSRGVRYMTLTHSDTTDWADSATDAPRHGGLTDFGRQVVREMNRLGMLVDISHVAVTTIRDALEVSEAPVIASHSNARAIAPHPRNIPDAELAEIGHHGGVVMVVFFPGFVIPSTARAMEDVFATWRAVRTRLAGNEGAIASELDRIDRQLDLDVGSSSDICDHIEHIAAVAGIDAVGVGSDYDGMSLVPADMPDVGSYPRITEELIRRGWSDGDLRKFLGDNILRVMEHADAVAAADPTR